MTNYISEIAKTSKRARFNAIVKVLTDNGIPFEVQPLPYREALGNIIVTMNQNHADKKIAVTAHYDNCHGTPGANDNAAACSILLNIILSLKKHGTDKRLEFVFFDLEESGFRGSKVYCDKNRDTLRGVFNLDMCGMGTNTVVSLHHDPETAFPMTVPGDVHVLKMLPPGDAYTFIQAGVPTVYVINSTDRDLAWFRQYAETGSMPHTLPDFGVTMHFPGDTPDTCNFKQTEKIVRFIYDCIQ